MRPASWGRHMATRCRSGSLSVASISILAPAHGVSSCRTFVCAAVLYVGIAGHSMLPHRHRSLTSKCGACCLLAGRAIGRIACGGSLGDMFWKCAGMTAGHCRGDIQPPAGWRGNPEARPSYVPPRRQQLPGTESHPCGENCCLNLLCAVKAGLAVAR